MLEQELKEIWKSSSESEKIKFDLSRLMIELENRMSTIDNNIRKRDMSEIIVSVIMIPIFSLVAYQVPFLLSKIGAIISVVWFIYVIYRLVSTRKFKVAPKPDTTFRDQLFNQKRYIKKQANLLDTVLYWYLIPPFIAHAMFMIGLNNDVSIEGPTFMFDWLLPISLYGKIGAIAFAAILYFFIYRMNKKAVRQNYLPVIKSIEQIEQQLAQAN